MPLGGLRGVLASWREARDETGETTVLAVVTATSGSTYRKAGAMALLDARGHRSGALSGGCLEPELERRARAVLASGRATSGSFDTDTDGDRVFGSGLGCRGRLDTALLPLPPESDAHLLAAVERAFAARERLRAALAADGSGCAESASVRTAWSADGHPSSEPSGPLARLELPPPPALLLLGAGPETPLLVSFTRSLGWTTALVEPRGRWAEPAKNAGVDALHEEMPSGAFDAAVVMSHAFDTDLAHLRALAAGSVPWIGLLGPAARRDELLREMGGAAAALEDRLHGPVGLPLGGRGAEAIALAIAAQLQQLFAR